MIFDDLYAFRDRLNQETDLKHNTRKKYYQSLKNITAKHGYDSVCKIPASIIEQELKGLKTKNDVSAAKRSLELFAKYFSDFRLPERISDIAKHKKNYKKRKWEVLNLDKLQRTINGIPDKKLKYAYRLMLATGMRVSEVEQIRKRDISIKGDEIEFYVEDTKKGCPATISCHEPYLQDRIPDFLTALDDNSRVFHSADTMVHEAAAYSFECHDLRRGFSKIMYRKLKPELGSYKAVNAVRELLRHESCRTTKIYLRRKML